MPKLFGEENENYSLLAQEVSTKVRKILEPIYREAEELGVPLRELAYLINEVSSGLASERILLRAVEKNKKQRPPGPERDTAKELFRKYAKRDG